MTKDPEPQSLEEARALLLQTATATPPPSNPDDVPPKPEPQVSEIAITEDDDENLPLYTTDKSDIWVRLQELANTVSAEDSEALPVLEHPPVQELKTLEEGESLRRRRRIVTTFFDEIAKANVEMISAFLHMKLVSTETTNETGRTPLLAAVDAGKSSSVKALLEAGASINAYGITETVTVLSRTKAATREQQTLRTPLQFAAELGNLALVKLFMASGADDSLVAPDGQLALRLAATHGHQEIVDFLPLRRGGGLKRWKAKHRTAMRRIEKAFNGIYRFVKFFVWDVPALFVYYLPKYLVVYPILFVIGWLREHAAEIPEKLANVVKSIWKAFMKVPAAVWRVMKATPGFMWDVVKATATLITQCVKHIWQCFLSIPHAINVSALWVWSAIKGIGAAVVNVFARFFSFVHTLVTGVTSWFQRITLADIGRGFVSCLRAVFVDLPKKLWEWTCSFGQALKAMFGKFGETLWFMVEGLWKVMVYIPKKIGEIFAACGSSIKSGANEVMVWFNPKRV